MRGWALLFGAVLAGCYEAPSTDLGVLDFSVAEHPITATDRDGDGLEDAEEARLATAYLPFLSLAPDDLCPTNGLVVRVTPGENPGQVRLRYGWLFDRQCRVDLLPGDGGSFALVVDPSRPAPEGMISLRAVARQYTTCQRLSTCGQCLGQLTCDQLGGRPAVWAARDRHSLFASASFNCHQVGDCTADCVDSAATASPPIVNVGEPDAPLVRDLTDQGFIRPELGWQSTELAHYDPWSGQPFGAAPPVVVMLTGELADPPSCAN